MARGKAKSKNKGEGKNGKTIINNAIEEAKERLKEYQEEEKAAREMSEGGGGGKGGKGGLGGAMENAMMGEIGGKSNPMAEFLGELGGSGLVMLGGFVAGVLQGMSETGDQFDFANRNGIESTPKNLNSEEKEVYEQALIDAFGYTGFQVGDWKNWMSAEEYISQGGFQDGDRGASILGLLQDGEYYKVR